MCAFPVIEFYIEALSAFPAKVNQTLNIKIYEIIRLLNFKQNINAMCKAEEHT